MVTEEAREVDGAHLREREERAVDAQARHLAVGEVDVAGAALDRASQEAVEARGRQDRRRRHDRRAGSRGRRAGNPAHEGRVEARLTLAARGEGHMEDAESAGVVVDLDPARDPELSLALRGENGPEEVPQGLVGSLGHRQPLLHAVREHPRRLPRAEAYLRRPLVDDDGEDAVDGGHELVV